MHDFIVLLIDSENVVRFTFHLIHNFWRFGGPNLALTQKIRIVRILTKIRFLIDWRRL